MLSSRPAAIGGQRSQVHRAQNVEPAPRNQSGNIFGEAGRQCGVVTHWVKMKVPDRQVIARYNAFLSDEATALSSEVNVRQ